MINNPRAYGVHFVAFRSAAAKNAAGIRLSFIALRKRQDDKI
jgi:hypothetical protein